MSGCSWGHSRSCTFPLPLSQPPRGTGLGEHWASVTDIKQSLCQQAEASSPPHHSSNQGSPVEPQLPLGKDLCVSVLCFTLFSLAGIFFPICLFPVPSSYYPHTVFNVLDTSPPFSFQPRDGTGSSPTSHHCFPKPELKTKKNVPEH